MKRMIDVSSSLIASSLRRWGGTSASKQVVQPDLSIKLYDRENCPKCRLVREALTELNLDVEVYPCPEDGERYRDALQEASNGSADVPFLVDENTGAKESGVNAIVSYLFRQYKDQPAPDHLSEDGLPGLTSSLASYSRFNHGRSAKPSKPADELLTLYSFESSPYSRLVRERLCEYEIAYRLINLGKQQWADMGPAKPRLTFKPYKPLENTKRWEFWSEHGNVQVPYLIDPNTEQALFESGDILKYLDRTYGMNQ